MTKKYILPFLCMIPMMGFAQVGEHRNQFAVGVHGGCNLNNVDFVNPKINQKLAQGMQGGLMVRYTCEKYFNTICSIQMELNYSQLGWEQDITDGNDNPVQTISGNGNESFKRTINYFQIPVFAHLAWGKETKGVNFFFNAGPVIGFYLNDSYTSNYTLETINFEGRGFSGESNEQYIKEREKQLIADVQNKLDYGIAAGMGIELHINKIGRIQLEGRYYYGLGNIFNDSKKDYFGRSAHQTITIGAAYLFDL